ncbi:MAG: hypothetical protein L6R00_04705 [Phycisphaerae bacterium]|nr:hypothetical protein [Phycisphaerae bacterium]
MEPRRPSHVNCRPVGFILTCYRDGRRLFRPVIPANLPIYEWQDGIRPLRAGERYAPAVEIPMSVGGGNEART